MTPERIKELIDGVRTIPEQMHVILDHVDPIKVFATNYGNCEDAFFLGRSLDYAVALEGALKLKEISYIHAEAYAAGELKHGTLALIEEGVPVIVLATQAHVYEKTISNLQEVKSRGAIVIGIGMDGDTELAKHANSVITIPRADQELAPILAVIPCSSLLTMQLLPVDAMWINREIWQNPLQLNDALTERSCDNLAASFSMLLPYLHSRNLYLFASLEDL